MKKKTIIIAVVIIAVLVLAYFLYIKNIGGKESKEEQAKEDSYNYNPTDFSSVNIDSIQNSLGSYEVSQDAPIQGETFLNVLN